MGKKIRREDIEPGAIRSLEIGDLSVQVEDLNQTDSASSATGDHINIAWNDATSIKDYIDTEIASWAVEDKTGELPNQIYTLAHDPVQNSLLVILNGLVQYDYSIVGNQVTLGFVPDSSDISLIFKYRW